MKVNEIINDVNWAMLKGNDLTEHVKNDVYNSIIKMINMDQNIQVNPSKRNMRSMFVIMDHDIPNTFRTFNGFKPKTKIFYSNYCELELLRILYLLNQGKDILAPILEKTKQRIRTNCFGRFCPTGECFEISIAVLRFIATVFPEEEEWIDMYIERIYETILAGEKKIAYQTKLYFCQTLYEIDSPLSHNTIFGLTGLLGELSRRFMKPKTDYDQANSVIIQNCMSVLSVEHNERMLR